MSPSLIATVFAAVLTAAEGPQVPEGFTVEVVAAFPQIQRPIFAHFDDVGRLYVGESSGENLNRAQMLEKKPHWITCLEDTNNDGVFDKSTRFVDNITLPQGMLWYRGSVYCACPPSIWKFTDTDGDGKADQREEILTGFGFNGNACDTHGPFLSPTGRLYIAQGRHGHEFKDKDGKTYSKGKAARIYSCRLDGSDVRVHCGGGFDNPVEIEFTEEGELLGTVNILYPNRGDCLMHWVEGGVYPREDQQDCISEFKWTGGLLGPIVDMGHVALSGLMRYRGTHFGPEYKDHLFVTEFNTHKVKRIALKRNGSTFAAEPMEFLTCPDGDFHPTDVLEDADGSLLVVDTGAWFLNGCPTSRVSKPDVTGAIYRIRKTDGEKIDDPRGLRLRLAKADQEKLVRFLEDPRPAVREQAIDELSQRRLSHASFFPHLGSKVENGKVLLKPYSTTVRRNMVWALGRMSQDRIHVNNELFALLHMQDDPSVRQAVLECTGWSPEDWNGDLSTGWSQNVAFVLNSRDMLPQLRLAALHAASRALQIASQVKISDRFAGIRQDTYLTGFFLPHLKDDRVLEHATIVALQRLPHPPSIADHHNNDHGATLARITLIAAEGNGRSITQEQVMRLFRSPSPDLNRTALEVLSRHPGWAKEALGTIREWLGEKDLADDKANAIRTLLVSQANDPEVQKLIAELSKDPHRASLALEMMGVSQLPTFPESWVGPLLSILADTATPAEQQHLGVQVVLQHHEQLASQYADQLDTLLLKVAGKETLPDSLRCSAYAAVFLLGVTPGDDGWFRYLMKLVSPDTGPAENVAAARALSVVPRLTIDQRRVLASALSRANPLILTTLLKPFERDPQEVVGLALIEALSTSSAADSLGAEELSGILRRYPANVQTAAAPLLKKLGVDVEAQQARLTQLAPLITDGDAKAGERVFFGKKANCSACHTVAGKGARIGPDLSRIGQSRTGKDLLEAIVYPSASFVNGYRPHVAQLDSGKTVQGIIAAESNDAITIRTADLQEVRVLRKDIEELKESSTSIMPKGLDTQLTPDELRHLLAFLQARK